MKEKIILTKPLTIGPIKEIVLLGGGKLLRELILWAKSEKIKVKVITSPRHEKEYVDKNKFSNFLREQKIQYITTNDINTKLVKDFLRNSSNVFYLSCGSSWIFNSSAIISLFNNKLFNLHSTGLPQNRGGGGYSWQIMMGIKFGYSTLHLVDSGIDTGPIIKNEQFLFPAGARIPIDFEKVAEKNNLKFVTKFITDNRYKKKIIQITPQQKYLSTYWPRLNSEISSWIDWSMSPEELERFICAFDDPYSGAKTLVNGKIVKIKGAYLSSQDGPFHSYQNGIIYRKGKNWLCVALNKLTLIITKILDEKHRNIFEKINVGDRLATPGKKLELSHKRIIYSPSGLKKEKKIKN